jgi:hypothetical protein
MVRFNTSGQVVSRVIGEFTITSGGSPEKLDIDFQDEYFKYYLFRDGNGNPSSIIDGPGRTYKLCKTSESKSESEDVNTIKSTTPLSNNPRSEDFLIGTFDLPSQKMKIKIFKESGILTAELYQNGKPFNFNTKCGMISKMVIFEKEMFSDNTGMDVYLVPKGCLDEPENPGTWKPNYIWLRSTTGIMETNIASLYVDIYLGGKIIGQKHEVKKVKL